MNRLWSNQKPRAGQAEAAPLSIQNDDKTTRPNESSKMKSPCFWDPDDEEPWELLDSDVEFEIRRKVAESELESEKPTQQQIPSKQSSKQARSSRGLIGGAPQKRLRFQKSSMGKDLSRRSGEAEEEEDVQGNEEPVRDIRGTQPAASPGKSSASYDVLAARTGTLQVAPAKQLMESDELQTKLSGSSETIDGLKADIDHTTTQSGLLSAQLDEAIPSRADMEKKLDSAIKNALTSAMETQDSARTVLGARVLELGNGSSNHREEARDSEVSLLRSGVDNTVDLISERFEIVKSELEATHRSTKAANERLDEHRAQDQARDESIRVLTAQYRKMKESMKNLHTMDQNRDEQADILMKHSEENRRLSLRTKEQADELRQLCEKNHGHVMKMFEEHETQMRLLEDAVKNCEVHLEIRQKPSPSWWRPTGPPAASASGPSSRPAAVLGDPSSTKRPSLVLSDEAKKYRPTAAETCHGPSEPPFRVPKPIVDPRYGNVVNPELIQEIVQGRDHRHEYPYGCTNPTCWECRNLKRQQ